MSTVRGFSWGLISGAVVPEAVTVAYGVFNQMPTSVLITSIACSAMLFAGAGLGVANAIRPFRPSPGERLKPPRPR